MPEPINTSNNTTHFIYTRARKICIIHTHTCMCTGKREKSPEILKPASRQTAARCRDCRCEKPPPPLLLFPLFLSLSFASSFPTLPWCPSSLQCTRPLSPSHPIRPPSPSYLAPSPPSQHCLAFFAAFTLLFLLHTTVCLFNNMMHFPQLYIYTKLFRHRNMNVQIHNHVYQHSEDGYRYRMSPFNP